MFCKHLILLCDHTLEKLEINTLHIYNITTKILLSSNADKIVFQSSKK